MNKRVLITGATGFVGRHCIPFLKEKNYEIIAVTSKKNYSPTQDVEWIFCNLLDKDSLQKLFESIKPTHLFHLAWDVTPGKFWNSKNNLDWVRASINLLEEFSFWGGKRAVFAGTCSECNWNQNDIPHEMSICDPEILYGNAKAALRLIAESFCKQMGISFAWGRIFLLYGPYEYPERFIPSVINKILRQEPVLCSHGNQIRDFLHVEDVARGLCTLLDSDLEGIANIASGMGIRLKQMIQIITNQIGGEELIQLGALPTAKHEPDSIVAPTLRLQTELLWAPRYSIEEGLAQVIAWWQNQAMHNVISANQYRGS